MKIDVFIATNHFPAGVIETDANANEAQMVNAAKDLSMIAAFIDTHPHFHARVQYLKAPGEKESRKVLMFYEK